MALVRCTCVTTAESRPDGLSYRVVLPDPDCPYVVHRVVLDLTQPEPA